MDNLVEQTKSKMSKSVESYESELATVRTGIASASILDRIEVMYYGFKTPLNQVASISVPEARMLLIKPYEKSTLKEIEKAIVEANLGLTPNNDGTVIRIIIPALTEERRKELCKQVSRYSEDAKVAIRNIRRDANDTIKKNKEISEDSRKGLEEDVQKLTDEFVKKIDAIAKDKEKDIMSI